jgi:hypothetical protein
MKPALGARVVLCHRLAVGGFRDQLNQRVMNPDIDKGERVWSAGFGAGAVGATVRP